MKKEKICEECNKPRFGGCAMTGYTCKECGKTGTWGSTDIPQLCDECAEKLNKCSHCGKKL